MDQEYQEKQAEFMANHNGSTPVEIIIVGLPVHFSLLFVTLVAQWLHLDFSSLLGGLIEVVLTVLPTLLSLTVLSDQPERACGPMAAGAFIAFIMTQRTKKYSKNGAKKLNDLDITEGGQLPFLTNFRSSMMLITTICILAVDFPVFPRRFAKTEAFGYGLMDLGVGSFVFSAGLVAPEARAGEEAKEEEVVSEGKEDEVAPDAKQEKSDEPRTNWKLAKSLKSCLPLLALGLARLASVTITGYHSHVTEYGLHWNFFFTLAAVKLLSSLVLPVVPIKLTWVVSVVLVAFYEGILTLWLGDWIMSDIPRTDLITANREGLFSCIGYLAIYLAGVSWGHQIWSTPGSWSEGRGLGRQLSLWVVMMWASLWYSSTLFLPPSRRMANYTFYTWIVAYNLTLLTLFLAVDLLLIASSEMRLIPGPMLEPAARYPGTNRHKSRENHKWRGRKFPKKGEKANESSSNLDTSPPEETKVFRVPHLYAAMSSNGLAFFLLANLLTGLVNIIFHTIEIGGCSAVVILSSYLATLCCIAIILKKYKVRLKCW